MDDNAILLEPQCTKCWTEMSQNRAGDYDFFVERRCMCRTVILRVEDMLKIYDALTTAAEKTALLNGLVQVQYSMQGEGTRWARSVPDVEATCKAVTKAVEGCPATRAGMKAFFSKQVFEESREDDVSQ